MNGRGSTQGRGPQGNKVNNIKFAPQGTGKGPIATYAMVKDKIVSQIQKSYKNGHDVAKCIKKMKVIDLSFEAPTRFISSEADDKKNALEQKD